MLIDVHLLLQKQNKEWSDSSSESNLEFYLIYFQEITQQVEYLSLRELEDFSKYCFFAHFKKLCGLSLTESSNDSIKFRFSKKWSKAQRMVQNMDGQQYLSPSLLLEITQEVE